MIIRSPVWHAGGETPQQLAMRINQFRRAGLHIPVYPAEHRGNKGLRAKFTLGFVKGASVADGRLFVTIDVASLEDYKSLARRAGLLFTLTERQLTDSDDREWPGTSVVALWALAPDPQDPPGQPAPTPHREALSQENKRTPPMRQQQPARKPARPAPPLTLADIRRACGGPQTAMVNGQVVQVPGGTERPLTEAEAEAIVRGWNRAMER